MTRSPCKPRLPSWRRSSGPSRLCSTPSLACRQPAPSPRAGFRRWLSRGCVLGSFPEAFLAQFHLCAQQTLSPGQAARQSIGKLTGAAQTWYSHTLPSTGQQRPPCPRSRWGCARLSVSSTPAPEPSAPCTVTAQPTQGGAQRLLVLDQREEQMFQHLA